MSNSPANIPTIANVEAFRAFSAQAAPLYPLVYLQGFYSTGDGGQGIWVWSEASTATDNTGTIINPTGNPGNGRWLRQFSGPLHDLWFGVKADGATDNTLILQAVEDAANALALDIHYPWQPNIRVVTDTLTTYSGVAHSGDGINMLTFSQGVTTGLTGSVIYCNSNSAIPVFKYQASTGVVTALPAPQWRDMNVHSNGGGGIQLNSSTGGFTDNLSSQAAQINVVIENVGFNLNNGANAAIELYKCADSLVTGCFINAGSYSVFLEGSDNIQISRNVCENAGQYAVYAIAASTFGNMLWIRDNAFNALSATASGSIFSSYRSAYIEDNFLEPNLTLSLGVIVLDGGFNAHVTGNEISFLASTPNWLVVNGTWANLKIDGNFSGGANIPPAIFNSGAGHKAYFNSVVQVNITGNGTVGGSAGIPFLLQPRSQQEAWDQPPVSGQPYWSFGPNISVLDGSAGSYYSSVMIAPGCFYTLPAMSGTGSQIGWTAPFNNITDTVDVWVFAYASVSGQTLSIVFAGTTYTEAITATSNPNWFKVASAVAVTNASSIQVFNADTGNGGDVFIAQVKVLKH